MTTDPSPTGEAPGTAPWAAATRAADSPASVDPVDWPTGRLLSLAARRVEREWNAHLGAWDLNHAGFPVLIHLLSGPRSQRELAAANDVSEQTMSRTLSRLVRYGYAVRSTHPGDRRRHTVTLTDKGRAACLQAADTDLAEELVVRGLTPEQVTQLRALLAVVAGLPEGRA